MSAHGKIGLRAPSYLAFLVAQFLGAANDNAFKITIVMFVLASVPDEPTQVVYSSLATALLPIPFLLFSPLAGWVADRFPKHRVLIATKAPEVAAMLMATLAFSWQSLPALFLVLFLMATQSAFFSPAKYGILPEVFANEDLSSANGWLELATNLAILSGSIAGVFVFGWFRDDLTGAGLTYLGVAVLGAVAVLFAPRAPAGNPQARLAWNVFSSAREDWREVRKSPVLFYTVLGIAWFGFLGSVFLTILPVFGKNALALSEERSAILLALLSIGVAAGSVLAARLSRGHVELGLVPLGSLTLSLFAVDLALSEGGTSLRLFGIPGRAIADLAMIGLASGLFIIPLNALLQQRAPAGMKGRLIAFSNVLTFGAVLAAAGLPWVLTGLLGFSTGSVILFVSLLTVAGTLFVMNLLPDFFVRLVLWLLTNTAYRIRVLGIENVPKQGALFVANHVSWVDFLMIGAACDRMIRFLMYRGYYEWRLLHWFFRRMGTIPVAGGDPPEKTAESLEIARQQIEAGHAVCIFAEGAITRTGNLLKFRRGLEKIASGVDCPIVPICLDGVWGSLFSYERGKFFFKRPKRFRAQVTVVFGKPLSSTATALEVRRRIQELSTVAFDERKHRQRPLAVETLRTARRRWRRPFLADAGGDTRRFGEALVDALALRDLLFPTGAGDADAERVGILLPPGIPGALAHLAVVLAGKIPVSLPDSVPPEPLAWMIRSTGVGQVLSNASLREAFLGDAERAGTRIVLLDEIFGRIPVRRLSPARQLWLRLAPLPLVRRAILEAVSDDVDATAAILFSYPPGREERPLAVALSHHNLLSDIEALRQVLRVEPDDTLLGVLPLSNTLAAMATLWLPTIAGLGVAWASGPRASGIGRLCERTGVSLIPAAPETLEGLLATVTPEELARLRFVAVGGGALTDDLRRRFIERFGVEPVEGWGCPECAPVVALNVPDVEQGKSRQVGTRPGTNGHPLPGVTVRIVDPATGCEVPAGEDGFLEIRGPNVFSGYANDPERTREVLVNGWFRTGERASLDSDGFLTVHPAPTPTPAPAPTSTPTPPAD